MKKKQYILIICADDFGISESRNRGILRAIRRGNVARTSILANGTARAQAVDLAFKHKLPVGLHLNLTEGKPLAPLACVKSLLGDDGKTFRGKLKFRARRRELNPRDVENEVRAQIQWFRETFHYTPKWIDGHQHCHVVSLEIARTIARVFKEEGVRWTRIPSERRVVTSRSCAVCSSVSAEAAAVRETYKSNRVYSSQAFAGLTFCGNSYDVSTFVEHVEYEFTSTSKVCNDETIICEMMTHPGEKGKSDGTCWDAFDMSPNRVSELETLCDPSIEQALLARGIELCRVESPIITRRQEALILVDVQVDFWTNMKEVQREFSQFPTNITRLLKFARQRNNLVIHVQTDYTKSGSLWFPQFERFHPERRDIEMPFDPSKPRLESFAFPLKGEIVIGKTGFAAGLHTNLIEYVLLFTCHSSSS